MELTTEILCNRLIKTYPLLCPKNFYNYPVHIAYFAENTTWEDGIAYIVKDQSMEPRCLLADTKSAFFCLWENEEPQEETKCDVIFLSPTVNPCTLLNDINRIFSEFNHWEQLIFSCPYTTDGIKEIIMLSKQVLRGRVSMADIFLNYVLYNRKIQKNPAKVSFSNDTNHDRIYDLINDPLFYKYESVQGVFLYPGKCYSTLGYNLYQNKKFNYRLIYNNFTDTYTTEEYYIFEYLAKKISTMIEHIPSMSASIPSNSPLRNSIYQIIFGTCPISALLNKQLKEIGWANDDDYYLILMEYYFKNSEFDAPLFHIFTLEHMYSESIAIKHKQGLILILNLTQNAHLQNYKFLDTFSPFIRESMYKCGISAAVKGFSNLNYAYMQATFALQYGLSHMEHFWYFKFEDFYLQYMISQIVDQFPSEYVCHPALHQMRLYDEKNKTELYQTLYVFMNCQYNSSKAARELHIHRTTLLYRLDKIYELTNINLENWETRLHLMFSYQLLGV